MTLNSIGDLQWRNRIILVQAQHNSAALISQLHAHDDAISDRDIVWFVIEETGLASNYDGDLGDALVAEVRGYFSAESAHRVVLIGKDGTVKRRSAQLDLTALDALIDGMPMRQAELRRQDNRDR